MIASSDVSSSTGGLGSGRPTTHHQSIHSKRTEPNKYKRRVFPFLRWAQGMWRVYLYKTPGLCSFGQSGVLFIPRRSSFD